MYVKRRELLVGRRGEAPLVPPYILPNFEKALALQYTDDEDGTVLSSAFTVHGLVRGYWYYKDRTGNDIPVHAGHWFDGKKVSKEKKMSKAKGDKALMETLDHKPPTLIEMRERVRKNRETK